jgi:DNA-binding beta-propeller fold protein YncE
VSVLQVLLLGFLIGLSSCSPGSKEPGLHSRVFSHAEIIGLRGTGLGQFTKPRSLALDWEDHLYVVDMTGRVQKFSRTGELLSSWRMPETDLGKPKGMCRDTNGNIVVLEPHYQRVNHFASDGTLIEQWGGHGTNIGQLTLPRSVAVNSHGELFVSEYTTVDRVQGFTATGHQPLICFGRPGTGDGEFNRAEGLGIDAQDRIYVADSCNHRIQIFSRDGKWLKTYGRAGRGPGELSYPYDIRVDRQGRQYVCEFGNSRIQVFDTNQQSIEIIGGPGSAPGQFNNPWAIALDSQGNLYVADAGNHRVQKLVREKQDLSAIALRPLSTPGEKSGDGADPFLFAHHASRIPIR